MKRGVSQFLVTSILVGFTIIVSVLVIVSGTNIQKSAIKNQETDVEKLGLVDFDVQYQDSNCLVQGENCYRLLLINKENFPLSFLVTTSTSLGSDIYGPQGLYLSAYDQKVFTISYPSELGVDSIKAEVKATKNV